MNQLGDNFMGCRFNSIQLKKNYKNDLLFEKNDIELTVSIRCMTMNRRRLQ